MKLTDNIRYTVNGTFDLYKVAAKKFYPLSLSYSIASSIFAVVISAIFCVFVLNITDSAPSASGSLLDEFLMSPLTMQRFQDIVKAIMILSFGIYGIFLLQEEKKGFEEKYNLKDLIKAIPKDLWNQYLFLLAAILLVNGVFFEYIFDTSSEDSGLPGLLDYTPLAGKLKFYNWINSMIELIKTYLPYFLAMVLIMFSYNAKLNSVNIKKYKTAFLSALILCFCIDTLSVAVVSYVDFYIINLIKIPFVNELIPGIFGFLIGVLITAFFYLGFAAIVAYPFKYENTLPNNGHNSLL